MLVGSISSFYQNVFYPTTERKYHSSNIKFVVCKCFQFGPVQISSFDIGLTSARQVDNFLPRNRILLQFKLKTPACNRVGLANARAYTINITLEH